MENQYRFLGRKKRLWLGLSLALFALGAAAIGIWRLPFGIDFRGGAVFELQLEKASEEGDVREKIATIPEIKSPQVSRTGENTFLVKALPIEPGEYRTALQQLEQTYGTVTEKQFQNVGPTVSKDLGRKAVLAVVLAAVMIILYLAYSFREVTYPVSSWRFGVIAVIGLLHDLVISVGIFAILAHFFHFEVDASFITALLTVMGFSVHDTIVVFDRIRENLGRRQLSAQTQFEQIADDSLGQTLNRSLATSLTVIFTLTALTVLGGESIRGFVVMLLIGVTIGTYSSIFTATPMLAWWQDRVARLKK